MQFNKRLLDIVACPVCKGRLVYHDAPLEMDDKPSEDGASFLVCRFDRLAYPIKEGIPVLLESESLPLSAEALEQVKKHD